MEKILSTRAGIRQVVITGMSEAEVHLLVRKVQEAIDAGYSVDEPLFEEYIGEVLDARGTE